MGGKLAQQPGNSCRPYQDRMLISGPSLLLKALKSPGFFPQEKEILHTHTLHTPHFATIAAAGRRAHPSCSSAHLPAVVVQHECCLNVVSQCTYLLLSEKILQQREDALAEAELGEIAKTTRAASAQAGKAVPLSRHQLSMASE